MVSRVPPQQSLRALGVSECSASLHGQQPAPGLTDLCILSGPHPPLGSFLQEVPISKLLAALGPALSTQRPSLKPVVQCDVSTVHVGHGPRQ